MTLLAGYHSHIREYQAQLFTVQKLSPRYRDQPSVRLRFFYIQTLKKPWSIADTPYAKKRHRLATILSQEEVAQLIDAAPTAFYRTDWESRIPATGRNTTTRVLSLQRRLCGQ